MGAIRGSSEYGGLNIREWLQLRKVFLLKLHSRGIIVSRTTDLYREADVFWEETGKSTRISQRSMGPDNHIKIAEIMSGRSYNQQGEQQPARITNISITKFGGGFRTGA